MWPFPFLVTYLLIQLKQHLAFFFSVICANISGTLLFCFYAAESRKIQLTGQRVVCFWDLRLLAVQWVCDLFLKGTSQ